MIQAESEAAKREEYLQRLMNLPNQVGIFYNDTTFQSNLNIMSYGESLFMQKWAEIIGHARGSVDFLKDQDVIRTVLNILQVCPKLNM